MTRFLFAAVLFWSAAATAQMDIRSAKAVPHNLSVFLSKPAGGWALGAAYEYMYDGATGVGAHLRSYSKEDSGPNKIDGYMILGAALGHHFFKGRWDLAFTPSFNMISVDSLTPASRDDTTTMGPGLGISLTWTITDMIAVGFDYSNFWVWLEDDWAGLRISDMAIKAKFSF